MSGYEISVNEDEFLSCIKNLDAAQSAIASVPGMFNPGESNIVTYKAFLEKYDEVVEKLAQYREFTQKDTGCLSDVLETIKKTDRELGDSFTLGR